MSTEFIKLKNSRKAKRRMIKIYTDKVSEAINQTEPDVAKIKSLFTIVSKVYQDSCNLNEEIAESLTEFDDILKNEESVQKYALLFHDSRIAVENLNNRSLPVGSKSNPLMSASRNSGENSDHGNFESNSANNCYSEHPSTKAPNVHLPKLTLPKFSGGTLEWQPFWQIFNVTIHSSDLSEVEKFTYMLSQLEGEARMVVAGLPVTNENYAVALKLLKEKYSRSDDVIRNHMQNLLQLSEVNDSSVKNLNTFIMHVESNMRGLDAIGIDHSQYDRMLFEIITSKISRDLALRYARSEFFSKESSAGVLQFLKREVESLQFVVCKKPSLESSFRQPVVLKKDWMPQLNSTIMNLSNTKPAEEACSVCRRGKHKLMECEQYQKMDVPSRRNLINQENRCFNCLLAGHRVAECKLQFRCRHCGGKHHTSLHGQQLQITRNVPVPNNKAATVQNSASYTSSSKSPGEVTLATARIHLSSKDGRPVILRALLDTGSEDSYIREDLLQHVPTRFIEDKIMSVYGFGEATQGPANYPVHQLTAQTAQGSVDLRLHATKKLCVTPRKVSWGNWPHLQNIRHLLADFSESAENQPIDVVIGADNLDVVLGTTIRKGNPVAIETVFGWVLLGISGSRSSLVSKSMLVSGVEECPELLKLLFEDQAQLQSAEPFAAAPDLSLLDNRIARKDDGRYEVKLPWTTSIHNLDNLYKRSLQRMYSLQGRLNKEPDLLKSYWAIIQEYTHKGYIEKTILHNTGPSRLIPHHPVVKPDAEKTKVRVVFDASATDSAGISENSLMAEGPNLNPDVIDVLVRFRFAKYGLTADVEQAFLQISISEFDRNMCKFLWLREDTTTSSFPFEIYRFCRLPFGLRSSPFVLAGVLRFHFKNYNESDPQLVQMLDESMYVDDLVCGVNSPEEASSMKDRVCTIFQDMQMKIRKWSSNFAEVEDDDGKSSSVTSVLGMAWNKEEDSLQLKHNFQKPDNQSGFTRRSFLRQAAKIYDPLGLISPFILQAKVILRDSWKENQNWDDLFNDDLNARAHHWESQCEEICRVKVPRNIGVNAEAIYAFCDASETAYAACLYTKSANDDQLSLLISKSKISPNSGYTLPRLELQACLLGARLTYRISKCFNSPKLSIFYFTDSMIVFHWITSLKQIKDKYVQRRVDEIRNITMPKQWNHVSGVLNPADIPSRGADMSQLLKRVAWWNGPSLIELEKITTKTSKSVSESVSISAVANTNASKPKPIIQWERFSRLSRLIRTVAYVLRFKTVCMTRQVNKSELSTLELEEARNECIRQCQLSSFTDDLAVIKDIGQISKESRLFQLNPFLDLHGVLRSNRRLEFADGLSYEEKFPVILDGASHFCQLLIVDMHNRTLHSNLNVLLNEIRNQYTIIRCRQTVKRVLNKCPYCRWKKLSACQNNYAPLPKCRSALQTWSNVFEYIGIDHFGPLYTSDRNKTYGVIFTCLCTRALHLELVASMSADDFLKAFERFRGRRGCPVYVVCDNSKTFKYAENILTTRYGCQWQFIVERAPWQGGVYERLIKSVKDSLKASIHGKKISWDQLCTLMCSVEAVINSRQITFLSLHPEDPVPPAHFLVGKSLVTNHSAQPIRGAYQTVDLRTLYQGRSCAMQEFVRRWRQEFLRNLRAVANEDKDSIQEDDVVFVDNERQPHTFPVGIIEECQLSRDGKCRAVLVKTATGRIRRPVQKIFLIERRPGSVANI